MEECERFVSFANPVNISLVAEHEKDSDNEDHGPLVEDESLPDWEETVSKGKVKTVIGYITESILSAVFMIQMAGFQVKQDYSIKSLKYCTLIDLPDLLKPVLQTNQFRGAWWSTKQQKD